MNNISKLDFTGQHLYIGMDVHKKSWSICIMTDRFEHKTFSQTPDVGVLVNYLKRNFPGASYHAVYEAGFSGFWTHDRLREQGVDCMVANPADIPTKDKERAGKTDGVDCRKLARSLRSGELEGIYVPPRAAVEDRSLLRTRRGMVKKQTRCKNQIASLLAFYGIHIPEELAQSRWSKRFINWIDEIRMEKASGNYALKAHLDELNHIRQLLAGLNRNVLALSKTDQYQANIMLLKTVPGISTLTAMTFLTELNDIKRFSSLDRLASYVGLVPNTNSSGEKNIITGITNRRNPALRYILIESSWVAVRKDPVLMQAFEKLCKHMTKTNAIVHIAKKLLNRIRYVLKNQKEYVPGIVQ
jgi:transposase